MKKRFFSIIMTIIMIASSNSFCVSATELEQNKETLKLDTLFWEEEEATDCKFYAEIDGVVRECTREEYAKYGIRRTFGINDEKVTLTNEEYANYKESGELPLNSNNTIEKTENTETMVMPATLTMMAKWNFTSLTYPNHIDTSAFNYTAANSNKRVTLNLRQWRSSGSDYDAVIRYQVLQLDSNGLIIGYLGEETVCDCIPRGQGEPCQITFNMNNSPINNVIVRVTSQDQFQVSGFGEIYNY